MTGAAPGTAARIRACRVRAGLSREAVAAALALNAAWYADLEQRDDEIAATLTLFQAAQLASLLGVALHELFADAAPPAGRIPLVELPDRLAALAARENIAIEALEERIGWPLTGFLASPVQVAAETPLAFLQAVAGALDLDWLSFAPDGE